MRTATITRHTLETQISLTLNLDGKGEGRVDTGCGFLNHMLTLFARHGRFDLNLTCTGDHDVDDHHTVEDVGICLGMAFKEALGDCRASAATVPPRCPWTRRWILSAVDLSGRGMLRYTVNLPTEKVGTFDTELGEEFWLAFTRCAGITLHIRQLDGTNSPPHPGGLL